MASDNRSNGRSPSTTTQWQWAKIQRRPQGPAKQGRRRLSAFRREDSCTLTVRYLGGGEAWIEIRARGQVIKVPGHRCLLDVLNEVWGQS